MLRTRPRRLARAYRPAFFPGNLATEVRARWPLRRPRLGPDKMLALAIVAIVVIGAMFVVLGGIGSGGQDSRADVLGDLSLAPKKRAAADAKPSAPARRKETRTAAAPAPAQAPAATATPDLTELASPVLEALGQTRKAGRAQLARATTAEAQTAAARRLESAYANAASRVERLGNDELAGLVGALRKAEGAYGGLAVASANVDQEQFDVQRQAVMDAEAAVAHEQAALR